MTVQDRVRAGGARALVGWHRIVRQEARAGSERFRTDIQGLRAISVLLVLAYHADVPFVHGGFVGVDVFFVISGFLITGHLVREVERTGTLSLRGFYARRARRLLPAAALVAVVTAVAARTVSSLLELRSIGWDAIYTGLYSLNYRLAVNGVDYQRASGAESPFQHYWSLGVEEQFYLLWPLAVLIVARKVRADLHRSLVVVAALIGAASLWASVTLTTSNAPLAYFSLHTRAWELACGALLAVAAGRLGRLKGDVAAVLAWAGLAALCAAAVLYGDSTPFPGSAALLPVAGAAALIGAGCATQSGWGPGRVLASPVAQFLGRVSYSWYLWHWPVVVLVPLALRTYVPWYEKVLLMGGALVLSVATHRWVEEPALRRRLSVRAMGGLGLGLSAAVVCAGLLVQMSVPPLVGPGTERPTVAVEPGDATAVGAAVAAALDEVLVPRNLRPSLDVVGDDVASSTESGCHADFLDVEQGECVVRRGAAGSVVLIGDSHAQQWLPAVDVAAEQTDAGLVTWTKAACPLADYEVQSPELNREYTECMRWREQTVDRVIALRPDVVFVGQSDRVPGRSLTDEQWAAATLRTVDRIRQAGIRVVYLLDTPYPSTNGPGCIAEHLDDATACVADLADGFLYPDRHQTLAAALAEQGIELLEPAPWLCSTDRCPAVVGPLLVYRDGSHISTEYSRWLGPLFVPLLPRTGG